MGLFISLKSGALHYGATASPLSIPLPGDVQIRNVRPCFATLKGRTIITGQFSPGLILDESLAANRLGIRGPVAAPSLAGTGSGTITGSNVGYLAFSHRIGDRLVARSNLGPPSAAAALVAQQRLWGNLPTDAANKRVNTLEGWVSFAGALPRIAFQHPFGITTFTEGVPILSLGAETPAQNGIATYRRYPPPYCLYVHPYRSRVWFAGDPAFPFRVWYTPIGELEGVGMATYLDTRDKEGVVGLGSLDDHMVVFCTKAAYAIQGLGISGSDFEIEKISPTIGAVSHHSIVNIHRRLFFASQDGPYMYDGAFHPLMAGKKREEWIQDYLENPIAFQNSIAMDDRRRQCYVLLTPRAGAAATALDPASKSYIGNYSRYLPETGGGGGSVDWTTDWVARRDLALVTTSAASPELLYVGGEDQYVRLMNVEADVDDDGDLYLKKITLKHPHFFMGSQDGDDRDGKTFVEFWAHLETENVATTVKLWAGDERASGGDPDATLTFGPGALPSTSRVIKTLYNALPKNATGRGLTVQVEVSSPDADWRYRGFGGNYLSGVSRRGGAEGIVGQRG